MSRTRGVIVVLRIAWSWSSLTGRGMRRGARTGSILAIGSSTRSSTRCNHRNHDRKWDWYVAVVPAVNRGLPRNVASSCHDAASGATPIRRWNRPSSRTRSDTVRSDRRHERI